MLISRIKPKKTLLASLALLFFAVGLLPFIPVQRASAFPSEEMYERRIVAAFGYCIVNSVDTGDNNNQWEDMFDDDGELEYAVVGKDIDSTNGVWTCMEVINGKGGAFKGAAELLNEAGLLTSTNRAKDSFDERLAQAVFGRSFDQAGQDGFSGGDAEDDMKEFAASVIQPYLDARPVTVVDIAERLLPLASACYSYTNEEQDSFEFKVANKDIWANKNDFSYDDAKALVNLNSNDNFASFTNAELGHIDLGFDRNFNAGGVGDWDSYKSDFYPLGHDFYNYSSRSEERSFFGGEGYTHHNSVVDCPSLKRAADVLYQEYTIDPADGTTLTLLDGRTAADIESEGQSDLDFTGGGANDNPTCESQGLNLTWVLCPLINGALDSMDWMFRQFIEPFLLTQPLTTEDDDLVYQVWKSFRTIGNILLVFGLLFIVFGQAIGGGLVDAYTAKKAMPRILVAAIFINLSYFGVALLVDIFNIIGSGVGQLISAPLGSQGSFNFSPNNFVQAGGLLAIALGGGFVLNLLASSGFLPLLMLTVFLPMMLAVIGIFGTLIVRRGIIILLAVTSPIAAALFILPNTEKYARQWLSLFIKTLMVYPIIMAIFAVADMLSVMLMNANIGLAQQSLSQFIGLIVLFVPFFLIPFAFKFAGGAIATIAGAASNLGKKTTAAVKGNEHDQTSRIHNARKGTHTQDKSGKFVSNSSQLGGLKRVARKLTNYKGSRSRPSTINGRGTSGIASRYARPGQPTVSGQAGTGPTVSARPPSSGKVNQQGRPPSSGNVNQQGRPIIDRVDPTAPPDAEAPWAPPTGPAFGGPVPAPPTASTRAIDQLPPPKKYPTLAESKATHDENLKKSAPGQTNAEIAIDRVGNELDTKAALGEENVGASNPSSRWEPPPPPPPPPKQ